MCIDGGLVVVIVFTEDGGSVFLQNVGVQSKGNQKYLEKKSLHYIWVITVIKFFPYVTLYFITIIIFIA
jgi:hypothetical protein